jgi:putative ABC transport system ATP-binding protein
VTEPLSSPVLADIGWLLPPPAVIDLREIGVSRPGNPPVTALSPVDLAVCLGELVTVAGPPRPQTSALLQVIGLLDRPTRGRYLLNGLDTAAFGERDRAAVRGREIGFVFGRHHLLLSRSARDNVALGLLYLGLQGRRRRSAAMELLDRVGMAGRADTVAGRLSASEQQFVAIARALAGGPRLLLCEEPTGGLDSAQAAPVIDLITRFRQGGAAVLAITSDPALAAYGNRTVAIGPGPDAAWPGPDAGGPGPAAGSPGPDAGAATRLFQ